jgi:RHS repeat-associated protein
MRGWFRYLAACSGAAVVLVAAPPPVDAAANAGVHLHKTVDPFQLTVSPNIGVTLAVDKATAIPGDTLTYTAVVSNPTATFGMGGEINAEAVSSTDATVAYYWDQLEVCNQGCGNGKGNPHWTAVAAFEATSAGYQPVTTPALHTGMSLAAQSVTRSGVTYPTSGDPILGTLISAGATATWTYLSRVTLTPAQIAVLSDTSQTKAMRNVIHFEVTPRNANAAQPYTDPEVFDNPLTSAANPGALTNVTVTFTLPDGTTSVVALAGLNPGGSATGTAHYTVPVPAARGSIETESAYVSRLHHLDGSTLTATAVAAGSGFSGTVYATSAPVTTTEFLPLVTIAKSGPAQVNAGDTETNPLALQNVGGATASLLLITDTLPGGATGSVSGTPTTLAPSAAAAPTATYSVPTSAAEGSLTDTAIVSWQDANGNSYGPLSSSFTTTVHNILAGAALTLTPASAGPNTLGATQTLTATLLDRNGNPIPNQTIQFTVTGVNPGTGTAITNASGQATFTYTGNNAGSDVAIASVVAPGFSVNSNTSTIAWGRPLQVVSTSIVQGNFFANDSNVCSFGVGPGSAAVFGQSFPDILFNPSQTDVPHDIANVTNFTRPFTDLTTDVNGNYNGTIVAQGNGQQAGAGSLVNFFAEFTGNFVVAQPGDMTFRILHNDGYVFGVGGGATRVNGDLVNEPAATAFNSYPVMAAWNVSSTGSSSSGTATVHFPAAGSYPYEIDYTECSAGDLFLVLLTEQFVAQTSPLSLYVGYVDGVRGGGGTFPFPWVGSPNVTFHGCAPCTYDAGALRFENSSPTPITLDSVTVDLGTRRFDLWPRGMTLAQGQILILTENNDANANDDFDTSDFSPTPCNVNDNVIPAVNVTINGVTTAYQDTGQVLNTGGFDVACLHNENLPWRRIAGTSAPVDVPLPPAVTLNLTPFNVPGAVQGQNLTLTVSAMDGGGNPQVNLPVALQVNGANPQTLTATTGVNGLAIFSNYTGLNTGTDTVEASAFIMGLRAISNLGTVVWNATAGGGGALAPSITNPSPADGAVVTKPVAVDATIAPPSGHSITSWRVFYQSTGGGPLVVLKSGTGAPPSPLGVIFDPTLLVNDVYILTIEATADNGAVQSVSGGVSVQGNLKLGRYTTTFQDLSVGVTGFQMQVLRTYDSTDKTAGDFGIGWHVDLANFRVSSNHLLGAGGWTMYDKSCTLGLCFTAYRNSSQRFVSVRFPDGHVETFDLKPDGGTNIFWTCSPTFVGRGTTSKLVALDDTRCSYTGDGNLYGASGPYNPKRFQLTTRAGQVLVLDTRVGLVSMTDRNGNSLQVSSAGVTSSSGPGIAFTRDGSGRITTVTGPNGQALHYVYSGAGDLASMTDPNNNQTTFTYDSQHDLLSTSGPGGPIQTLTYDPSGRLVSVADGLGHATGITNNVGAQQQVITDANGQLSKVLTFDDLGDLIRQEDVFGGQTQRVTYTYDSLGRNLTRTDSLGHSISFTYDDAGDVITATNETHATTHMTWTSFGMPATVVTPDLKTAVTVTYDDNGNAVSILRIDGTGNTYTFDAVGRPVTWTDPGGRVDHFAYDSNGHLSSVTDANGAVTSIVMDASGRTTSITDARGSQTSFGYDGVGNVTSITDPNHHSRTFVYDALNRLTTDTDALGHASTLQYDAAGRLVQATDRDGRVTTFTYDLDGNRTNITSGSDVTTYTYDAISRLTGASNSSASIQYSYDAASRLIGRSISGTSQPTVSVNYTYDDAGRILSVTGPAGPTGYSYDPIGRLASITDAAGGGFNLTYDSLGRVTGFSRPNGVNDARTLSPGNDVLSQSSSVGTSTYTYDTGGRLASRTTSAGTNQYTYDSAGQLIGATHPAGTFANEAYTYDAAGNRISSSGTSLVYDANNRLVSDGTATFTYDNEGDLLSRTDSGGVTNYVWDSDHHLVGVRKPDGTTTTYRYDPFGRRIEIAGAAQTTRYVYDGPNPLLEYDGSNQLQASFVTTFDSGTVLEQRRGANAYYYSSDALKTTTTLTDSAGAVAAGYSYDAFGNKTSTGAVANPFTFEGGQADAATGFYYDSARYYDPAHGRFISEDNQASANRYLYANNAPTNFNDPNGQGIAEYLGFAGRAKLTWGARLLSGFISASLNTASYVLGYIVSGSAPFAVDIVTQFLTSFIIGFLFPFQVQSFAFKNYVWSVVAATVLAAYNSYKQQYAQCNGKVDGGEVAGSAFVAFSLTAFIQIIPILAGWKDDEQAGVGAVLSALFGMSDGRSGGSIVCPTS